jgi:hypothetical protein
MLVVVVEVVIQQEAQLVLLAVQVVVVLEVRAAVQLQVQEQQVLEVVAVEGMVDQQLMQLAPQVALV